MRQNQKEKKSVTIIDNSSRKNKRRENTDVIHVVFSHNEQYIAE
jgi:hypothetical protein